MPPAGNGGKKLAWRNRQTRTAQDRVGKPVEVRILSRAPISVALPRFT